MAGSLLALLLPELMLLPAMAFLGRIESRNDLGHELKRKSLHVAVGVAAIVLALTLDSATMIAGGIVMTMLWLVAVRRVPKLRRIFGAVLNDTQRTSYGEFYFALALVGLLCLAGDEPLLFVIPVLVLTLADTGAAIVGRGMPRGRLQGIANGKTCSGSAAFLALAFLCVYAPLSACTELPSVQCIGIALAVATATCLAEAVSRGGSDNLTIPAVAYALLAASGLPAADRWSTTATTLLAGT